MKNTDKLLEACRQLIDCPKTTACLELAWNNFVTAVKEYENDLPRN